METKDLSRKVKSMIKKDFGMTFTDLKKEILKTVEFGSSDHFKSKNGYSIFYTNNPNYMQGRGNGGGVGFFARLHYVGMSKIIKL